MKLALSKHGFECKPKSKEIRSMAYETVDITCEDLIDKLKQGYCFMNYYDFSDETYKFIGEGIKKNHYVGSFTINIDLDHQPMPMEEKYNQTTMKPTFCYEGWSNLAKDYDGYSYRFIYMFDGLIEGANAYKYIYNQICEENNLDYDPHAASPYQYMNGTGINSNFIVSNSIYKVSDYQDLIYNSDKEKVAKRNIISEGSPRIINGFATIMNKEFEEDLTILTFKQLYYKYRDKFRNIEQSPIPTINEDVPIITLPEEWYEIRRSFYHEGKYKGYNKKIKDGENRRTKLWTNLMIRRLITPDLTMDELIFALIYEMSYYIENTKDDPISINELIRIAKSAINSDIEEFKLHYKKGRKRMVNPLYQLKYGGNKKEIANKANADEHKKKKEEKYQLIGEFYDFNLTIQQNIDLMNTDPAFSEKGYLINKYTIHRWKKENGLARNYNK